jgi:4-hydroxy-3-methylbut-2-en-1-yl diphosphate synthase IspG/GcpE
MSKENQTEEKPQTLEQLVESALQQIELDEVTPEAVFEDILVQTKMHFMRLMVAVAILEKLAAKKAPEQPDEQAQKASEENANPDLQVVQPDA